MDVVEVNCSVPSATAVTRRAMTEAERLIHQRDAQEEAQRRAAEASRAADRTSAMQQLKVKARTDPDLALVARVLGIEIDP